MGVFMAGGRLQAVLGKLGSDGSELVHVYDKTSNWLGGFEKGFALFKRPVLDGEEPEGDWAVQVDKVGNIIPPSPAHSPDEHPW
jgi:hypothetical protein